MSLEFFNKNIDQIEEKLAYPFKDKDCLRMAFLHNSYVNEHKLSMNNERLEFLGDSIFNLIVTEFLYKQYMDFDEGKLSFLRSFLIDSKSCALYMKKINLCKYVLLGKGEQKAKGFDKDSILANIFEAIIGSLYLDGGIEIVKNFIFLKILPIMQTILNEPIHNFKAELQEYLQAKYKEAPIYDVIEETGPDHEKKFKIEVRFQNEGLGIGIGSAKKQAEQNAAKDAMKNLKLL